MVTAGVRQIGGIIIVQVRLHRQPRGLRKRFYKNILRAAQKPHNCKYHLLVQCTELRPPVGWISTRVVYILQKTACEYDLSFPT